MKCSSEEELKGIESEELEEELRLWASYRGQTLTRTGSLSLPPSPLHTCGHTHTQVHAYNQVILNLLFTSDSYILASKSII